jgi:hypothetical protein
MASVAKEENHYRLSTYLVFLPVLGFGSGDLVNINTLYNSVRYTLFTFTLCNQGYSDFISVGHHCTSFNLKKYDLILTLSDRRWIYVQMCLLSTDLYFFADILDMKLGIGLTMKL